MKTALDALWASIVRTLTPIIVGGVLTWLVDIPLDGDFEATLTIVVTGALSGVYYLAVRLLERYVSPRFGWLLGYAAQPEQYVKTDASAAHN